jgi:Protein of unknown function (DUF3987)
VVVASGGEWVNPETGEVERKVHLHWRLAEPTRTAEDHARLKRARYLAQRLAGADATTIPLVHPLRWPGSWHRKGAPRLASILHEAPTAELDLDEALERLEEAAKARGVSAEQANGQDYGQDSDRTMSELVRRILTGEEYHCALRDLAFRHVKAGMAPGQVVKTLRGLMDASTGPRDERWHNRRDQIPMLVDTAVNKLPEQSAEAPAPAREVFSKEDSGAGPKTGTTAHTAPLDLFGDTALAGTPELTADMLPDVIAAFAKDEAERFGVGLAMVAIPCLAVTAAAIRDHWKIQPKRNDTRWRESARLWVAIVADSGSLKTPAMNSAVAPLKEVELEMIEQDTIDLEDFELQEKVYTRALENYTRDSANGKSAARPTKPVRPRLRRLITSDATTESLSEILRDNPGGVLSFRDELSGWLGSFDAYRSGGGRDRADWLELYNGGSRAIDRIRRGRCLVPNWSASLLGGIQPEPMRKIAKAMADDGLAQRFIVAHTARTGDGQDRPPDHGAIKAYSELIRRLVNSTPDTGAGLITLSEEAQRQRALVQQVAHQVMELPSTSSAFRAHLSKWPGLFARLLLTFHLAESDGQPAPMVSGQTAERVARFALDYLLPNAARFYADFFGLNDTAVHARWVAGLILAHSLESIRARDIYRAYSELRSDLDELTRTLAVLVVAGWLDPVEDVRGRPTKVWMVNPLAHTVFAARAAEERERRAAERERVLKAARDLGLGSENAA